MRNEYRNVKGNIPGKQEGDSKSVISRQNLIEGQSNDKEMLHLFKIALTPVEAEKVSVGYLIKDNILMRKWSPTECDNGENDETVYQIVVPTVHRREVLKLAHDCQCLVIWGYVKPTIEFYNIFWSGLKRTWQSGAKSATLANWVVSPTKIFRRPLFTPYQFLMNLFHT